MVTICFIAKKGELMKNCTRCGQQLNDDAKFCPVCGTRVTNDYQQQRNDYQPQQNYYNANSADFQPTQPIYYNQNQPYGVQNPSEKNKKKKVYIAVGSVAAVIILILIITIISVSLSSSGTDDTVSDDTASFDDGVHVGEIIDGNTYYNDYWNLSIDLPDSDWEFFSDSKIYDDKSLSNAQIDPENGKTYIEDSSQKCYYDMFLYNNENGSNIQVMILDSTYNTSLFTAEEMIDMLLEETPGLSAQQVGDTYDIDISGETYSAANVNIDYSGVDVAQLYALREIDGEYLMICITAKDTEEANRYLSMFY